MLLDVVVESAGKGEGGGTGGVGHVRGGERDGVELVQHGLDVVTGVLGGGHPLGEVAERETGDDLVGVCGVVAPGVPEQSCGGVLGGEAVGVFVGDAAGVVERGELAVGEVDGISVGAGDVGCVEFGERDGGEEIARSDTGPR